MHPEECQTGEGRCDMDSSPRRDRLRGEILEGHSPVPHFHVSSPPTLLEMEEEAFLRHHIADPESVTSHGDTAGQSVGARLQLTS